MFTVLLQTDPLFPPSTASGSSAGIPTSPKITRKDLTCNYDYYYYYTVVINCFIAGVNTALLKSPSPFFSLLAAVFPIHYKFTGKLRQHQEVHDDYSVATGTFFYSFVNIKIN